MEGEDGGGHGGVEDGIRKAQTGDVKGADENGENGCERAHDPESRKDGSDFRLGARGWRRSEETHGVDSSEMTVSKGNKNIRENSSSFCGICFVTYSTLSL
jgi:hypothetical protein